MASFKEMLSKTRKKDAMKLFQLLVYTISIVAFLTAIDYFSKRSSLRIGIGPQPTGYYMDTVEKFYKQNELELPKIFIEEGQFARMFKKENELKDYIDIGAATSDVNLITAIKKGQEIGGWIQQQRIESLERQIEEYRYEKHVYGGFDTRGFYPEKDFKEPLRLIKKRLSSKDYYVFLSALIFSREVHHSIFIKNDGEIDLRDLTVVIPAPLSKITERRDNNILDVEFVGSYLHQIKQDIDTVSVSLPFLKKEESFCINVITRENELEKDDIFYFFKEAKTIDLKRLAITGTITFFCMVLLALFFKGNYEHGSLRKS